MRILSALAACAALFSFGCGRSSCAVAEKAVAQYNDKRGECNLPAAAINGAACRDKEALCTAADLEKLDRLQFCTGALLVCTESSKSAYSASALACLANYEGMSTSCREATAFRL